MLQKQIQTNLESLQHFFHMQGYQAEIQSPIEEINPVEQLVLFLRKDDEGNDLVLRLFWAEEMKGNEKSEDNKLKFLQFYILFPFIVKDDFIQDLTYLIFNTNAHLDMAYFGLYPDLKLIYYRYTHVCTNREIDSDVLTAIVASIEFLLEMTLEPLKSLALGKKTLQQLQEETEIALDDQIL